MRTKPWIPLALSLLLAACLLVGCGGGSASSAPSASSGSAASASSESLPGSTAEANAPSLQPGDADENGLLSPTGLADAFAPCLGWGPGTAGCSLKSVGAAASLLQWAEQNQLAEHKTALVEKVFLQWYDTLDAASQENLAETWPLVRSDAALLLTDKASIEGRIEDAGLDPDTLPGCTQANWDVLCGVLDGILPEAKGEA